MGQDSLMLMQVHVFAPFTPISYYLDLGAHHDPVSRAFEWRLDMICGPRCCILTLMNSSPVHLDVARRVSERIWPMVIAEVGRV